MALDGGKGKVELHANGIIHLLWNPKVTIEGADAHAAMAAVNELCDGLHSPMLVDVASADLSREARTAFSRPSAASRIALLGSSPVDRVLANFFLGVRVPPCPTRFFTSRTEAMNWLLTDGPR